MGGSPPGWFVPPGCKVMGGRAPGPCCGCSVMGARAPCPCCGSNVMGGSGALLACALGSCAAKGCANPGVGVTGRSLGRCNTAAFTCGCWSAGFVLPVELPGEPVELPGEFEADWLLSSPVAGGFFTRESVRNPPLV